MFLSSCLVILWRARNGLLPCVGGYTCVRRRKGKHVRGEDTHAQSRSSAKQNDLLRGFLVLSSRPHWPAAATFPPRVFLPLSFSFFLFEILFEIFPSSRHVKSHATFVFFLLFVSLRFYPSKFNILVCLDKISVNLMFRLRARIDCCSWIVIISLLLYTLLRSIFLLQAIGVRIYLYLIIDLKRLRLS